MDLGGKGLYKKDVKPLEQSGFTRKKWMSKMVQSGAKGVSCVSATCKFLVSNPLTFFATGKQYIGESLLDFLCFTMIGSLQLLILKQQSWRETWKSPCMLNGPKELYTLDISAKKRRHYIVSDNYN
jgi:hypothetical protein